MTEMSFFWHDYETFGAVPRRDRPAQFAGVRTDADLNEIDDAVMVYCQPPTDTLPEPEACLLTGITPQQCVANGLPEREFAQSVLDQLGRPGTIGVGYNSIRFDDEVTRFLFWRNLIDPYGREWQNECGRWDLLDVVRTTWALRPDGITWPTHDDGRPSFKLEHLSAANGLAHDAAHDALSDVRATIALARLIKQRQPRLWDFCLKLRRKDAVAAEIGVGRPVLHLSGMYPVERGCMAIVWPFAPHPTNRNEVIVWDLAHDPSELMRLNADEVRQRLFTRADDLPAGMTRLPLKSIHINKSPIVIGNLKTLAPSRAAEFGIDVAQAMGHAETAARIAGDLLGLWADVFRRPEGEGARDVDEDLYGGFVSNNDRRTLERLRTLAPDALATAARRAAFEDDRLGELLFRHRARNFTATLDAAEQQRWAEHRAARLLQGEGGAMTIDAFFEKIDALGEARGDDERAQDILGELYDWAEQIAPEA